MTKYIIGIIVILLIGFGIYKYTGTRDTIPQNSLNNGTSVGSESINTNNVSTSSNSVSGNTNTSVKSYSLSEIAVHNNKTSCWTTIEGKVYDITSYVPRHPGGEANILKVCGKDGSSLFGNQHGNDAKPNNMLATFEIGILTQ